MTPKSRPHTTSRKQIDYKLIQQAIGGNQQAYQELMSRYRNAIFHQMYKMVSNREDADDLTQEAFSKAFHKLPTYEPNYAFSTWLFKIARNNAIDYIRKKKIHFMSIDDPIQANSNHDHSSHIPSNTLNPEQVFIHGQKVSMVRQVMGKLSYKYRLMIELRFFEELSYDEIARELDIPLGTVKAQLFRAKEVMRDLMQQPGPSAYLESTKVHKKKSAKRKVKAKKKVTPPVASPEIVEKELVATL